MSSLGSEEPSQHDDAPESDEDEGKLSLPDRKHTITFHSPTARRTTVRSTQPRITRMFQSISVKGKRRSSHIRPVLKFQPSYRLDSKNQFDVRAVEDLLKRVVEDQMASNNHDRFDPNASLSLCRSLSEEVLNQVKNKSYDRYRIIVTVNVGEKTQQSFCQKAVFLWDSEKDAVANYVYERPGIFVTTTVFGIYYD